MRKDDSEREKLMLKVLRREHRDMFTFKEKWKYFTLQSILIFDRLFFLIFGGGFSVAILSDNPYKVEYYLLIGFIFYVYHTVAKSDHLR